MKLEYIKLSDYKVSFKQLISGPAQVGLILNYVILAGKGILMHKNGYRAKDLKNNYAYAWTSELMVGLGLVYYVEEKDKDSFPLILTDNGKKLYELIREYPWKFNDKPNAEDACRKELLSYNKAAYELFFKIFKNSPICINLCRFISNEGTNEFKKSEFNDKYYTCFADYYGESGTSGQGGNAGFNRVPSLTQLCYFFGCLTDKDGYYIFDYAKLSETGVDYAFIPISEEKEEQLKTENNRIEKTVDDLISKYGIDGTVAREIVSRNSFVQELFRNNLIARYGCKCAICNKDIEAVMVASHIVPANESNVIEKADCENGLLLCALHDKLFDRYMISFDFMTGKLIYADSLKGKLEDYQLSEDLILKERFMTDERKDYLMKHNIAFYERNK